ncbi:MoaD/ThiS family protein [Desulfonatronospira sp.]|uniref:MoaD/ThiS family protein n=1 Tax=Desulfonatronospira sp. TaxID=1962951 RepID=UPI0025C29194|nr:MoaD/ThiS family protein [Desulfonatronospira sp.]
MQVQVRCYATLSPYSPPEGLVEMAPGSTPRDLIQNLGLPMDEVKIIFVNGKSADLSTPLGDQDRVGVFPAVGGG